jgi:hypothetical protein
MKYMLLIYDDEGGWESASADDREAVYAEYRALGEAMREAGVMVGGAELKGSSTATLVRQRDGDTLVNDGPFAETREQLGGYYLVDCPTLDDAIGWAARIPSAAHGTIEVRPLMGD